MPGDCLGQERMGGSSGFSSFSKSSSTYICFIVTGIVDWKKKNAQCASCKLSFIWDKMSTIAQETAYQIVLRNFSGSR